MTKQRTFDIMVLSCVYPPIFLEAQTINVMPDPDGFVSVVVPTMIDGVAVDMVHVTRCFVRDEAIMKQVNELSAQSIQAAKAAMEMIPQCVKFYAADSDLFQRLPIPTVWH